MNQLTAISNEQERQIAAFKERQLRFFKAKPDPSQIAIALQDYAALLQTVRLILFQSPSPFLPPCSSFFRWISKPPSLPPAGPTPCSISPPSSPGAQSPSGQFPQLSRSLIPSSSDRSLLALAFRRLASNSCRRSSSVSPSTAPSPRSLPFLSFHCPSSSRPSSASLAS